MQLYFKVGQTFSVSRKASPYYKLGHELLESGAGILLQSGVIFITEQDWFFKLGQLYYKKGQLLQSRAVYLCRNN